MEIIFFIIGILLSVFSIFFIIFFFNKNKHIKEINYSVDEYNKKIELRNQELENEKHKLEDNLALIRKNISESQNQMVKINEDLITSRENKDKLLEDSYNEYKRYCEDLDTKYKTKENEFNDKVILLNEEYDLKKEQAQAELDNLKKTRAAIIQARIREEEIKEKGEFYKVQIPPTDLHDINILNSMKSQLAQPRILSMLIWQTYFRTPFNTLCNNVVGTTTKMGIYKITNQLNDVCYIGQSVDISSRFKDHAKCGLGIDTPQGNKLYKAMLKDGLQNFSFEILEECSRDKLDEKEKYYIDLYDAYNTGYNNTSGNN